MAKRPSYKDLLQRVEELEKQLEEKEWREHNRSASTPAENELLDQLRLRKTLFDTIPNPIFYKNIEGVYLGCNEAFASLILGVSPEKIIGRTLYELPEQIPKKLADIYYKQDQALFQNPGLQEYEARVKCSDGQLREFVFYKSTYIDYTGEVAGLIGLMLDVTEKNDIQLRLMESEEKYRSMMESMSDAVYICGPDLTISYMNSRMKDHIGYDATGEKCHEAIHGLDKPCHWCSFPKVKEGEVTEAEVKSPKDGRTYIVTNSPIYHQDGTLSKMTIYHDITRRIKLENELLMAKKLEATGVFAGGIAHDYNNLLFIILGNLLMMKSDKSMSSSSRSLLKDAERAAQKAGSLTKRLLAFTHDESLALESVSIRSIIDGVLEEERDHDIFPIEIRLPDTQLLAFADSGLIAKVLTSLIKNSKEAMADGGTIIIEAEKVCIENDVELIKGAVLDIPGDYVRINIADRGHGIDDEILPHIFDPYYSTKQRGVKKGLGLGLSTSYSIMKKHCGAIVVDSTPGVGTVVSLYLPVFNPASAKKIRPV